MITQAFTAAAQHRVHAIGMPEHPVVAIAHPLTSKSEAQAADLAQGSVEAVVQGLLISGGQSKSA